MANFIDFFLIIQIFVLLNPLSSFPFFKRAYEKKMDLKSIAIKAAVSAFVIAVIILLIGPSLFSLFGITLDSFRIAGGIVLLLLGIEMVRAREEEYKKAKEADSIIAIIATPLLTGPATISFITIKAYEIGKVDVFVNLFFAFLLVGIVLILFALLFKKINAKIIDIASRVAGLFLVAIAIEMMSKGISGIILNLK